MTKMITLSRLCQVFRESPSEIEKHLMAKGIEPEMVLDSRKYFSESKAFEALKIVAAKKPADRPWPTIEGCSE